MYVQGSLLDLEALDHGGPLALGGLTGTVQRRLLTRGAWVDVRPGWITGAEKLFLSLQTEVRWRAERREMYGQTVEVPRLLASFGARQALPHPMLERARDALSEHYADDLGEPFATAGLCYYRDGRDSVAWHGDRIGRGRTDDTCVAIVSLGAARRLSLRPRGGGEQVNFLLGHGDLLVMGGSCQRSWDHAVLKTSTPVGPRISIQFRPRGVL